MSNASREFELEQALRDLITYMKALPLVPATYEAIKNAEVTLTSNAAPTVLEAVTMTPAGIVPFAARIFGRSLLLKASDLSGKGRLLSEHKDSVYKSLVEGYLLELKPIHGDGFYLFGPDIYRQKAFNDGIEK